MQRVHEQKFAGCGVRLSPFGDPTYTPQISSGPRTPTYLPQNDRHIAPEARPLP